MSFYSCMENRLGYDLFKSNPKEKRAMLSAVANKGKKTQSKKKGKKK